MRLEYSINNTIGTISPVNPPYNYLRSDALIDTTELANFLANQHVKGVIINGRGDHFCGRWEPNTKLGDTQAKQFNLLLETISFALVPVAAVITGKCLGPGLALALACHFRFASEGAELGFPDIPSEYTTVHHLKELVTNQDTIDRILSGSVLHGQEAQQIGLIDQTGLPDETEENARMFLTALTKKRSSQVIRTIMQSIHNGKKLPIKRALFEESLLFDSIVRSIKT